MTFVDDLNLKTTLKISDKEVDLELNSILDGELTAVTIDNDLFVRVDIMDLYLKIISPSPDQSKHKSVDEHEHESKHEDVSTPEHIHEHESKHVDEGTPTLIPKQKKQKYKRERNTYHAIFDQKELICKINSIRIYQPLIDYIIKNINVKTFGTKYISNIIRKYYEEKFHRKLKDTTADTYGVAYTKYLISTNIFNKINRSNFELKNIKLPLKIPPVKEDPSLKTPAEDKIDQEHLDITVKNKPDDAYTAEFNQWLENWENKTFTKGDITKCTTLSKIKRDLMLERSILDGNVKQISEYEYAKIQPEKKE